MSQKTLVAIGCYSGDFENVRAGIPLFKRHGHPVVVYSTTDCIGEIPGVEIRRVGLPGYIGQVSLDRNILRMRDMLTLPYDHFFFADHDSFCVSKHFHSSLYGDCFWSNEVIEPRPHESPYPKLALQCPYFFSRQVGARMLTAADRVGCHPITPYSDWLMLALCHESGTPHHSFLPEQKMIHPYKDLSEVKRIIQEEHES